MVFNRLVSFGEETNYGVAPADLSKWIGGVTSFNGGVETALEETVTLSGVRLRSYVVHGLDVRPSLEYYVQTGRFFKYALGSVSDSGTAPPYTHTIDISSGYDLPSISLLEHRIGNPQHGYLYTGAKVETVEVSWEEDSLLKASVEFLANNVSKVDTLPSVVPDTRGYFKASQKTVTINGTANEYVVSGNIRIANNHVRFPRKQDSAGKPIAGNVELDASLTLYYLDSSVVELMLNRTTFDVTVRFDRGVDDYIEFRLYNCVASVETELPAEGELMQTLNLKPTTLQIFTSDDIQAY